MNGSVSIRLPAPLQFPAMHIIHECGGRTPADGNFCAVCGKPLRVPENSELEALRLHIGVAIRARRKALGLKLAAVSERAAVSMGYLSQVELGKNWVSFPVLYRIACGLGVPLTAFLPSEPRAVDASPAEAPAQPLAASPAT